MNNHTAHHTATTDIMFPTPKSNHPDYSFVLFAVEFINSHLPNAIQDERPDGTRIVKIKHANRSDVADLVADIVCYYTRRTGLHPVVATRVHSNR